MISFAAPLSNFLRLVGISSTSGRAVHDLPQFAGALSMGWGYGATACIGNVGTGCGCDADADADAWAGLCLDRYSESRLFTKTVKKDSEVSVNACASRDHQPY